MRVNKYQPHVLVLPEDDADRQLANGFLLYPCLLTHRIQALVPAEGWMKVLKCFKSGHVRGMETCPHRLMVLLIDFDHDEDRLNRARAFIPDHLIDRVFVLGAWTNPQELKTSLDRPLEAIGMALAKDLPRGNRYDLGTRSPATQCRRDWPSTRQRSAVLV